MTGGTGTIAAPAATRPKTDASTPKPADVLVVFGITGDLLFGRVVKGLSDAGLTNTGRVVVEKPFGHDRESATALADELHEYIDESQLYRIDHFLGKRSVRFTRQDAVEETWRIMQPLLDKPSAIHSYAPGSWGPEAADKLVAEHGGWHGPWLKQ
jgi:glucose-6-phosphate 1-dehydrogenase